MSKSSVDDEKLILAVQANACLWDSVSPRTGFTDVNIVRAAWNTVGEIVEASAETCKSRWKVLRQKYVTAKKRPASGSASSTTKWSYFELVDSFLRKVVTPKSNVLTCSNVQKQAASVIEPEKSPWSSLAIIAPQNSNMENLDDTIEIEVFGDNERSAEQNKSDETVSDDQQEEGPLAQPDEDESPLSSGAYYREKMTRPRDSIKEASVKAAKIPKKSPQSDVANMLTGTCANLEKVTASLLSTDTPKESASSHIDAFAELCKVDIKRILLGFGEDRRGTFTAKKRIRDFLADLEEEGL